MKRSWCRTLRHTSAIALLLGLTSALTTAARATGGHVERSDSTATAGQLVFLEARVNHVTLQNLVKGFAAGNDVRVDRATFVELGLNPELVPASSWPGGLVHINALPNVEVAYDARRQQLVLQVPPNWLTHSTTHSADARLANDDSLVTTAAHGVLLNYNLHAQHSRHSVATSTAFSAWTEVRVPQRLGVFSSTMLSQWSGHGAGPVHTRLDSTWRSDFPESALSFSIGDAITSSTSWSRPVRIGGLRLGTDFGLQPYRSTSPMTVLQGQVTQPSRIDVYIGGMLQEQLQVLPGAFTIESLTAVDGAGMAQLVITDLSGQRRTLDVPIYGAVDLLREGLVDWSVELGAVREKYGQASFSYARKPMASGSWRYGWRSATTLEAHAEWGSGTRVVGLGGVQRLGAQGGIVSASLATSEGAGNGSGLQVSAGFQWNARPWRFSIFSQRTTPRFRDLDMMGGASTQRRADRMYLGFSQSGWDVGASAIQQQDTQGRHLSLTNVSLSRQAVNGWRWSIGLTDVRSTIRQERLGFTVSIPLDRGLNLTMGTQRVGSNTRGEWQLTRPAQSNDDWSWRLAQTAPQGSAQMSASRNTGYGQWTGSVDRFSLAGGAGSQTSVSTSFGGAVAWMGGRTFLSRHVDNAFALVSTGGLEGIPVRLENQPVGKTDAQGHLFVSRLNANQRNQLSADVLDLPYEISAASTRLLVKPQRQSGVKVEFPFRRVVSVRATLHDLQNRPMPAGGAVTAEVPANSAMVVFPQVGHGGEILVENPVPGTVLTVRSAGNRTCSIQLPEVADNPTGQIYLGVMPCQ